MGRAAVAQDWLVDRMVLVEPVALQRWKARHLLAATRQEDRWNEEYLATNAGFPGAVASWDRRPGARPPTRRHLDLLTLGLALRHGQLRTDLLATSARRVVLVRGDRSALSNAAGRPAVDDLRRHGVPVTEFTVPGQHALWHSLPAVDAMTRELRKVLDTEL